MPRLETLKLPNGAGNGKVLTSDASGNGTWQATGNSSSYRGVWNPGTTYVAGDVVWGDSPWNMDNKALWQARRGSTNVEPLTAFNNEDLWDSNAQWALIEESPARMRWCGAIVAGVRYYPGDVVSDANGDEWVFSFSSSVVISSATPDTDYWDPLGGSGGGGGGGVASDSPFWRPAGWCDSTTLVAATWKTLPVTSASTPPTIEPAAAFVQNADNSVTCVDAGIYTITGSAYFGVAGTQVLSVGGTPNAQNYWAHGNDIAGGVSAIQNVATTLKLAAGSKVYFTAYGSAGGQCVLYYASIVRETGVKGDKGDDGGTQGISIGPSEPSPRTTELIWVDTDEPDPTIEAPHYIGAAGEPAFGSGWSNYDAARAAYFYKDRGRVYLGGLVKGGASASVVFTLPVGYRPMTQDNLHYIVEGSPNLPVECRIAPVAGTVMATNIGASSVTAWFSLEGLHFRAA